MLTASSSCADLLFNSAASPGTPSKLDALLHQMVGDMGAAAVAPLVVLGAGSGSTVRSRRRGR